MDDLDVDERATSVWKRAPTPQFFVLLALSIAALVIAQLVWTIEPRPEWSSVAIAVVVAVTVGLVILVTGVLRDQQVWLGAVGLLLAALGADATWFDEDRLNWPLIGAGVALLLAAVAWAIDRRWTADDLPSLVAIGWLVMLCTGFVLLALSSGGSASSQFSSIGSCPSCGMGRPRRWRGRRVPVERPRHPVRTVQAIWADAAVEEHHSVEAFETLAVRLRGVGAGDSLVARSLRAAEDEVPHAPTCRRFAAAREPVPHARRTKPPACRTPFGRRVEVLRLGVESYLDGVVGEGIGAALLTRGAQTASPERQRALTRMAADEQRHAELAEDIVRWSLEVSPRLTHLVLRAADRQLQRTPVATAADALPAQTLEAAGLVPADVAAQLAIEHRHNASVWLNRLLEPARSRRRT